MFQSIPKIESFLVNEKRRQNSQAYIRLCFRYSFDRDLAKMELLIPMTNRDLSEFNLFVTILYTAS